MDESQMKNMVVLKNVPSNLVEEVIVIFKSRVSRPTGAQRRATGEIDIVAEFFVRKILGT